MRKGLAAIILGAVFCLALNIYALPAEAKTTHKHAHHQTHKKTSKSSERARIRTAQIDLEQLGYNPGTADGIMGRKTRMALKAFQRDHSLKADGILGPKTFKALAKEAGSREPRKSANAPPQPPRDFFADHPDFYGYYGDAHSNPVMFGSPQAIPSRYGAVEIGEQIGGQGKSYIVTLNGQSVYRADNQPSVINASRTFNLNNADAIIFTSFVGSDQTCPYRHQLLIIRPNSSGLHAINNCSRSYEAFTEQGSLYVSFPDGHKNGWASGDMWRYENGAMEQL